MAEIATVKPLNFNHKISIEDAKEALKRSGYLLECRVAEVLRSAKYLIETNPLYFDPITNKKREIDLKALNFFEIHSKKEKRVGLVELQLILECINNSQPLTFIKNTSTHDDTLNSYYGLQYKAVSGLPHEMPSPKWDTTSSVAGLVSIAMCSLEDDLDEVYTQYCNFKTKNKPSNEWMAFHDDFQQDCFNALCTVNEQDIQESNAFYEKLSYKNSLNINLHIPILIVQNEIWVVSQDESQDIEIKQVNFVNYIRSTASSPNMDAQGTHIYVVTENFLTTFLKEELGKKIKRIQDYCFEHIAKDKNGNIVQL